MKKSLLFLTVLASILINCSITQATLIGPASDYNVFVFDDVNVSGSDSQGRVAAGGNIYMSNYSVGLLSAPAQYSLVSGENVTFGSGSVLHGGVFAAGNAQLNNVGVNGTVTANGTVSPVDFAGAHSYLSSTSLLLAAMAPTGTTYVSPWRAIVLTGTEDINIFNLDGNALSHASSLTFNIGDGDIAIVNVSGNVDAFGGFGIMGYQGKQGNILYNFYEADQLTIKNIAIQGSILAPGADVSFNSGVINGTLIADSLAGTGQSNQFLFHHDLPVTTVPEPATAILLGIGLAGLFIFRKKILLQERFSPQRVPPARGDRTIWNDRNETPWQD